MNKRTIAAIAGIAGYTAVTTIATAGSAKAFAYKAAGDTAKVGAVALGVRFARAL